MAAEQGHVHAQTAFGLLHWTGRGVAQDYAEAAKWYRKAAEQSDPDAQANLGRMYDEGRGFRYDYVKAEMYYRLAAAQDHPAAQLHLGLMYADGVNMAIDNVLAYMWFELAAGQDLRSTDESRTEAALARELIMEDMTPEQIAEAKKLAREWRPKSSPVTRLSEDETSPSTETPSNESNMRPQR